jgi:CBS-domain-containing membrane protein
MSVSADTNLGDALQKLADQHVDHVWVIDDDGRVIGVPTRSPEPDVYAEEWRTSSRAA